MLLSRTGRNNKLIGSDAGINCVCWMGGRTASSTPATLIKESNGSAGGKATRLTDSFERLFGLFESHIEFDELAVCRINSRDGVFERRQGDNAAGSIGCVNNFLDDFWGDHAASFEFTFGLRHFRSRFSDARPSQVLNCLREHLGNTFSIIAYGAPQI